VIGLQLYSGLLFFFGISFILAYFFCHQGDDRVWAPVVSMLFTATALLLHYTTVYIPKIDSKGWQFMLGSFVLLFCFAFLAFGATFILFAMKKWWLHGKKALVISRFLQAAATLLLMSPFIF